MVPTTWCWVWMECLHSVFQKHKLCIRAPTRINPTNRFGETMFRYTRARLQQQERTRGFLMKAYIRVRLTHFQDRLYGHYKEHAPYFRELVRTMDEDPELSYKEYTDLKAQLLVEKLQEEECVDGSGLRGIKDSNRTPLFECRDRDMNAGASRQCCRVRIPIQIIINC